MTISGDGGILVPGPACRPPRFGLASVVELDERNNYEWAKGLEWDEIPCDSETGVVSGQCPVLEEQHKVASRGVNTNTADAFTVYAGYECSTGGTPLSKAWDNAQAILEMNWWRSLERALWSGVDQDGNPLRSSLTGLDEEDEPVALDLTPLTGALDIVSGIATLESFAGNCFDCEPIVHANRGLAAYLANAALLEREGPRYQLLGTGTAFSAGGGYDDSGPGGVIADPGEAWMFITGGVRLTTGPMFFTPERGDAAGAVDRLVNDVTVYAERTAAFQVGCCIGAVRVLLNSCCGWFSEESS